MSRTKLHGKVLAIQLTSGHLRIAKLSLSGSEPAIQATSVHDLPDGCVVDGVIHRVETVRGVLRTALKNPDYKHCKRVVFSLCTSQIITEDATLPQVPVNRLEKMLEANMDLYFPVDTQDYHMIWQLVRHDREREEMLVQMWAVSTSMVQPYYQLANSLGLSVVAIDYCGHSLASAVGASFVQAPAAVKKPVRIAIGSKKNEEKSEQPPPAPSTDLYLMAEKEHLLMLFVRNGHVELQRIFLCGSNMEQELGEVLMALDYYDSMDMGDHGEIRCHLCGALADDESFVALTREVLGLPVSVLSFGYPSMWTLALGAARTDLDFGVPALNLPGGTSQIHNAWQYGLILAGGIALALTVVATVGSKAVWKATTDGLENTRQTLQIQASQNANFAQNYYNYQTAYQNYSSDWDTVHNALHTFNDNLVFIIDELESVLPKKTSVVGIQIIDAGMALELASPSKEEAAYTIMALRELQYASLEGITDLVKPSAQGGGLPEGEVASASSSDNRYHYTVVLGYKSALIQAEQERKGLNYDAKVAELEVGP